VHFNASSLSYSLASWEEGAKNYVYAVSRREMEKVALGLDCPHVVFKGINDHYVVGCEYEPADADKSKVFNEMLETISMLDAACRSGNIDYPVLMVGIYKTPLDTATREAYDRNGFEITDLPRNPYIA
jgi:hypothetical protein